MKILAIRIKNLASLADTTEINFTEEPLNSAGIFAITGPTGAGKSTVLDALCLALYAKTPRYIEAKESGIEIYDVQGSTISQGDVRGILRDGTGEGFAEVDFTGVNGQNYRATWNVRRARSNAAGTMQADTTELKNITSNKILTKRKTETLKEIERLVGLNFEQFTRSVLLAQGDFTAFLKATKDDKSSLLEKLTGTYIYSEISRLVFEKYKLQEQELRELNLRKEGIITLTEEDVHLLHEEEKEIDVQIKNFDKQIQDLNNEINWHKQLLELKSSQVVANTVWELTVEAKNAASTREQKLKQVEQVQTTRTWVDALNQTEKQFHLKSTEVKDLEENILTLQEQKNLVEKLLQDSEVQLAGKTKENDDAVPFLEEAKKLDTLLKEKEEQILNAKKEVASAKDIHDQQLVQLHNKQAEVAKLLLDIEKLKNWKNENITRQLIAENRTIIISKLADAQILLSSLKTILIDIVDIQETTKAKEQEKTTLETNFSTKQESVILLRKAHEIQKKELLLIPIETLEMEKGTVDSKLEDSIIAQAHWSILYRNLNDFNSLDNKLLLNQKESTAKDVILTQTVQQLATALTKKETSEYFLKQARLAAAENVESLRSNLTEGEPCPVCGSIEHPYALHDPRLNNVLSGIEEEYLKNEQNYLSLLKDHSTIKEACESLKKTVVLQKQEHTQKLTDLQGLQQTWKGFPIQHECDTISDEKKYSWFEDNLKALKTKQFALHGQIQSYNVTRQQVEAQKNKIEELEKELTETTNQVKDLERLLLSYREQLKYKTQEQEKATTSLSEVELTLNHYFPNTDWINNWKRDPDPFLLQINIFTEHWNQNIEKLDDEIQQHSILSATLSGIVTQLNTFAKEVTKKETVLLGLENNYLLIDQQRKAIFKGEQVQQIEARLKQSIEVARENLNNNKLKQEKLNIAFTKSTTQKTQLEKDLVDLHDNKTTYSGDILNWIEQYNKQYSLPLDYEQLLNLLSYTSDWKDEEQAALKDIADALTKALSVLNERTKLLKQHEQKSLSDRPIEEINDLYVSTKSGLDLTTLTKNGIGFRLQQDKENKEKIGDLLKTIATKAAVTENWSKLNEIIGSADGKKFRQIAQEYTLDVLLSYANIHLEMLTKRYKIQRIPASLGLQVVDQDMGDEVRTVYSLSGGESFLVSLALALGLASISSSRMKVESLFIDEGFGALDPATLNIAMDALERLHNQGRKVCVISHVQEMTERIPTQIKVIKIASGKSKVEVLGI
jgi:exonuclease SbcC